MTQDPCTGAANAGEKPLETKAYGPGGKEVSPEDPGALACETFDPNTGRTSHWAKRSTRGLDAGRLYNPQSPTFNRDVARAFHGYNGRPQYEWRKASAESFRLYKLFLETGVLVHLRHAERA